MGTVPSDCRVRRYPVESTTIKCPTCGRDAQARVTRRDDGGRTDVEAFQCPSGCDVDDEAVRQIIGTSGN